MSSWHIRKFWVHKGLSILALCFPTSKKTRLWNRNLRVIPHIRSHLPIVFMQENAQKLGIVNFWHWMCYSGLPSTLRWTWGTWWAFSLTKKYHPQFYCPNFVIIFTHDDDDNDYEDNIDQVGLYDQCVTVRLADGRIVEQNIYPGETHCKYGF